MEMGKTTDEGFFFLERWLLNIFQHNTARKNKSKETPMSLPQESWCGASRGGRPPREAEWEELEDALAGMVGKSYQSWYS